LKENRFALLLLTAAVALPCLVLVVGSSGTLAEEPPIYTDLNWTVDDSPVIINRSIEIAEGGTLRIGPGVEVLFDSETGIQVKGTLIVEGNETHHVRFAPNASGMAIPDFWEDVRLHSASAGNDHIIRWADFRGADAGLLVASTNATVEDSTFARCRYGIIARADARLEVRRSTFHNNTAVGIQWQAGSGGIATHCVFRDNRVGVYCLDHVAPEITDSIFRKNYHHASWAQNSTGAMRRCELFNSDAEALECYWNSTPFIVDVTISGSEAADLFLREGGWPRFIDGTPLSTWEVRANETTSYAIAGRWTNIEVRDHEGYALEGANVTLLGASGVEMGHGTTDAGGMVQRVFISLYTVGEEGGHDLENPHNLTVEWQNHTMSMNVTPREITSDNILLVVLDLSVPEEDEEGISIWLVTVVVIIAVAAIIAALVLWRRRVG
jgi:hypothetical protein